MDHGEGERVFCQPIDDELRGLEEVVTQTTTPALVPAVRLIEFCRSIRPKEDPAAM